MFERVQDTRECAEIHPMTPADAQIYPSTSASASLRMGMAEPSM
jgi:hypothetical protein